MRISLEMKAAWTEYWRTGQFESLPQDRAAGLLGALDSSWNGFFDTLNDGAKLLDLATGGGELLRRAIALGRGFALTGVDIADLAPVESALRNPGVRLVGHTDLSHLPFPDESFDAVMSQFGIEYADPGAATREAMRVLARGGRGHLVLHHAHGAITQGVVNSLAAERSVFEDGSAFEMAKTVIELRRRLADAEDDFKSSVETLQQRLLKERGLAPARNVVGFLANVANSPRPFSPPDAARKIERAEVEVRSRILRKQAQRDAALDGRKMAEFAKLLGGAGAAVSHPQELKYPGGRILGWSLSFHKP